MTAKSEGFWAPSGRVSEEDVCHMKGGVLLLSATACLRDTVPRLPCMAACVQGSKMLHNMMRVRWFALYCCLPLQKPLHGRLYRVVGICCKCTIASS